MKTTTKKVTLPKKPVTKRDKHFYDMGAKQQSEVFESAHRYLIESPAEMYKIIQDSQKDWSKFSPRKEILNDYQEPITDYKINWTVIGLVILGLLAFLYAMHGDQQALNAGFIH